MLSRNMIVHLGFVIELQWAVWTTVGPLLIVPHSCMHFEGFISCKTLTALFAYVGLLLSVHHPKLSSIKIRWMRKCRYEGGQISRKKKKMSACSKFSTFRSMSDVIWNRTWSRIVKQNNDIKKKAKDRVSGNVSQGGERSTDNLMRNCV